MKRPARIRIVGKLHSITYLDGDAATLRDTDGGSLTGSILHDKQEIYIENNTPLEQEQDTLLHEVLHGVERAMDLDLEETAIRRLATGLLAIIKDNPSFVSYLRQKTRKPDALQTPIGQ